MFRYDFDPQKTEVDILVDYGAFDTDAPVGGMELNLEIGPSRHAPLSCPLLLELLELARASFFFECELGNASDFICL